MPAHFINLDLEIWSLEDLSFLQNEIKNKVLIIHNDIRERAGIQYYFLCLEADLDLDNSLYPNASEILTVHLCQTIVNLSPQSRQLWNNCDRKIFNYGYQSGVEPFCYSDRLSSSAIARIANLNASIEITIYSSEDIKGVS